MEMEHSRGFKRTATEVGLDASTGFERVSARVDLAGDPFVPRRFHTVPLSPPDSSKKGDTLSKYNTDRGRQSSTNYTESEAEYWKANFDARITELMSEVQSLRSPRISQFMTQKQLSILTEKSFATMNSDGCLGCINLCEIVKHRRVAGFQCIWLLLCLVLFIYLGVTEYTRAQRNTNAIWKPLTMSNYVDHGIPGEAQYYTPTFLVRVLVTMNFYRNDDDVIGLLEKMFGRQGEASIMELKWFDVYCMYETESIGFTMDKWNKSLYFGMNYLSYNITREVPLFGDNINAFVAGLYIELEDPDPAKGPWFCGLFMETDIVTMFGADVSYLQVSVSRTKQDVAFDTLGQFCKIERDGFDYFTYSYSEKLTKRVSGNVEHLFEEKLETKVNSIFDNFHQHIGKIGRSIVMIVPELRVETWEEFIDYDYIDWLLGMGGMLSWISILFFWGAYYLNKFLDKDERTMGILPIMSFIFMNAEEVQWMKYQLNTLGFLSRSTSRETVKQKRGSNRGVSSIEMN